MLTRYKRGRPVSSAERHSLLFKVGAPCRDEWRTAAVLSGTLDFGIGEQWADVPCLGRRNEIRQFPAGVEHARLHSGLGDRDDLGDLFDRFAVEVHEIDDLTMLGRQPGQRLALEPSDDAHEYDPV
jgi:hypothetical protein